MKTLLSFFLVSGILILLSCDSMRSIFSDGKPYKNDTYNFSVEYPPKWEVNDTGFLGTAVFFISKEPETGFKPNVNVYAKDSEGLNLAQFVAKSKKGLDNEITEIGYKIKKFVSEDKQKLGKYPGFELTYLFIKDNMDLKAKSVYCINKDTAFILTFVALEADFPKFEDAFNRIIESFRIIR
jgi:hypothetical protein